MKDNIRLLYVDLFCGAGGTSTGIEQATIDGQHCAKVVACVNHDAHAIESHAANHPDAMHFTEDIRTLNLAPLVAHLQSERANTQRRRPFCGHRWNAPTSAVRKAVCHATLTAALSPNICSATSRTSSRITFRLRTSRNLCHGVRSTNTESQSRR